jgi:quinol monooxygenase YgiN
MYTATMLYHFKPEAFEQACEIWKNEILDHAKKQKGFIRMQFLTASPKALAIGTWEDNQHARSFMETGVFKRLMEKLKTMVVEQPQQSIWELRFSESRETKG